MAKVRRFVTKIDDSCDRPAGELYQVSKEQVSDLDIMANGTSDDIRCGCVGRVVGWVQAQSGLITGVGVGVGVLEVAGLVAAASLCRAIRSTRD
ncbi:CD82 antigen [Portunus trituberculatus]|uniref:CD82 antigen n=1 Tax=Portunus trituberculatus TaxID=210409 RepID=A0A5B7FHW6_PORTR|nr:CD82 antigen [Portunus trituberculatus]